MSRPSPPRFLVDRSAICGGRVHLTGSELHHLRVRRLRDGDLVRLFDSTGAEYTGKITRLDVDGAEIEVTAATQPQRESPLRLALAQAVLKGAHTDLVIEKATELGVAEIVLFTCERSVVRPSASRLPRWQRIAASAAKQCNRTTVPAVATLHSFDQVIERARAGAPAILFHPAAGSSVLSPALTGLASPPQSALAIVGPEGGFTAAEVERARHAGCTVAGLGPRVLRAETAALAVTVLCQFLWGDLGHQAE